MVYKRRVKKTRVKKFRKTINKKTEIFKTAKGILTIPNPSKSLRITGPMTMPQRLRTKFRYAAESGISTTAQGLAGVANTYVLNNLFRPDVAFANQPLFFDELTALYRKYRVLNAKIIVEFTNPNVADLIVGVKVYQQAVGITAQGQTEPYLREQPLVWMKQISNTGSRNQTFTLNIDIAKALGISRTTLMNDDQYQAFFNASPAQTINIDVFGIRRNAAVGGVDYHISVLFDTSLYALINPNQS